MTPTSPSLAAVAVIAAVSLAGPATGLASPTISQGGSRPPSGASATARIDPSAFTKGQVFNPYFPLRPGVRMVYAGSEDGKPSRDVVDVTRDTRVIEGVICRVVRDRLYLAGILRERTRDWYAQARNGAVWYFGEATEELDRRGHVVSREGSWMAGRDGARPGVIMTAHPQVGQTRAQEHYPGHAEDRFRVIDVAAAVSLPVLASDHAVLTREWTPLEPGVVDHKYYVRDIGLVDEKSVRGPTETGELVAIRYLP
jgi:hypothetical protein